MRYSIGVCAMLAALTVSGCDRGKSGDVDKDEAKTDKGRLETSKAKGEKKGATRQAADEGEDGANTMEGKGPEKAVTSPTQQTYPDGTIKPIANNCAKPFVIMSTAPNTVGQDYPWTWTRQAMLANQQFKVVDGEPAAPGQVSFQLHLASPKYNLAWVLVAKCKDGGTCNKLAAMYKAVIKNAQAQPVCGRLPMDLSPVTFKKPVLRAAGFSSNTLPEKTDVKGMCARLQACTVAMDTSKSGKETIGFDCQKAPSKFKTACARKYPCQAVMSCLEGG